MGRKRISYKDSAEHNARKDRFLTEQMKRLNVDESGAPRSGDTHPAPQTTIHARRRRLPGNTCG